MTVFDDRDDIDDGSYDPPDLKTLLELRYPLHATRLTQLSLTNKWCLQSNTPPQLQPQAKLVLWHQFLRSLGLINSRNSATSGQLWSLHLS